MSLKTFLPIFFCFAVGLMMLFFPAPVLAQDSPSTAFERGQTLSGLSAREVEELFGPPDERKSLEDNRETWMYGRSVILFKNGKVTAWSNAGEMRGRRNLATIFIADSPNANRYLWENPWTPRPGPTAEEVIEELFSRLDASMSDKSPNQGDN